MLIAPAMLEENYYGYRPTNNWGQGSLPAPWAEGDIVQLSYREEHSHLASRLHGMHLYETPGFFVVSYATSIDEGDAWYFRVRTYTKNGISDSSDRLHVIGTASFNRPTPTDWMAQFTLIKSSDPDGLALRNQMLKDWVFERTAVCFYCNQGFKHTCAGDTNGNLD